MKIIIDDCALYLETIILPTSLDLLYVCIVVIVHCIRAVLISSTLYRAVVSADVFLASLSGRTFVVTEYILFLLYCLYFLTF